MKFEIYPHIFGKKNSNIKFDENPCRGSQVVPCWRPGWQTGVHDEANSRFS